MKCACTEGNHIKYCNHIEGKKPTGKGEDFRRANSVSILQIYEILNRILGGKVQVCWNVLHLGIVQPEVIFIKRLRNLVQPEDRDAQEMDL